jgi:hypothetical protein
MGKGFAKGCFMEDRRQAREYDEQGLMKVKRIIGVLVILE